MSRGQQRYLGIMHGPLFAERQNMLASFAWHSRLHQSSGALRHDDLRVRRDVIAVGVRDEREPFRIPRVEPQILRRQINAALVTNLDHARNLPRRIAMPKFEMVGAVLSSRP